MKKNKKLILSIILVIAVLGIGTGLYAWHHHQKAADTSNVPAGINLSPATPEDKKRDQDTKQQITDQQNQSKDTNTATTKSVTPTITYAGQYSGQVQVGARVSGLVESSGTCTATITKAGVTHTKQVAAVRDASSMDCPEMDFASSDVTPGTWSVTVAYSSSTASGTSASQTFEAQ